MALREIIILPDKRLRLRSEPVKKIGPDIRALVEDMFETMYDAPGIGLAAIQIGVPRRVVTMDLAKKDDPKDPKVLVNPEIVWSSAEKASYEEGCLSIPGLSEPLTRPERVVVEAADGTGLRRRIEGLPHRVLRLTFSPDGRLLNASIS